MSSASSTIEATIGERFPLPPKGDVKRYRYGLVICIFMGCVYVYVIVLTLVGPEYRNRKFDVAHDSDLEEMTHRNDGTGDYTHTGASAGEDRDVEKVQNAH